MEDSKKFWIVVEWMHLELRILLHQKESTITNQETYWEKTYDHFNEQTGKTFYASQTWAAGRSQI
jgi:hypothetical protein